jgi:hypothetical protein
VCATPRRPEADAAARVLQGAWRARGAADAAARVIQAAWRAHRHDAVCFAWQLLAEELRDAAEEEADIAAAAAEVALRAAEASGQATPTAAHDEEGGGVPFPEAHAVPARRVSVRITLARAGSALAAAAVAAVSMPVAPGRRASLQLPPRLRRTRTPAAVVNDHEARRGASAAAAAARHRSLGC